MELIKRIYEEKFDIKEITKNAFEITNKLTWENNAKEYIMLMEE